MRTITIPALRVRPTGTSPPPLPAVPRPRDVRLRCVRIPAPNPLVDLSDDAIDGLVEHLEDGDVAMIVDSP
jgi:hypothetical protein